jgi:alanyl-tRNA synthetase
MTSDIGQFKIINQSSIASGVRRIEALRGKQLSDYLLLKEKKDLDSFKKAEDEIKKIMKVFEKLNVKPKIIENSSDKQKITNLNKQLTEVLSANLLKDKTKNIIKDKKVSDGIIRFQKLIGYPTNKLSSVIDFGKKEISKGIIITITIFQEKVGVAVGVTNELTEKYDAVTLVKIASEVLGGKGGGGRKDFAQAGGVNQDKIEEAFAALSKKIN